MITRHTAYAAGCISLLISCAATAQNTAVPPAAAAAPGIGAGQVFGLFAGTLLVLAVIGAIAWAFKRFAPSTYAGGGIIRVVAGAAVGQRERVVVVEVGGAWLVVGVAPGSVNLLQQMPRAEMPAAATTSSAPLPSAAFATWLRQVMEKRNGQ